MRSAKNYVRDPCWPTLWSMGHMWVMVKWSMSRVCRGSLTDNPLSCSVEKRQCFWVTRQTFKTKTKTLKTDCRLSRRLETKNQVSRTTTVLHCPSICRSVNFTYEVGLAVCVGMKLAAAWLTQVTRLRVLIGGLEVGGMEISTTATASTTSKPRLRSLTPSAEKLRVSTLQQQQQQQQQFKGVANGNGSSKDQVRPSWDEFWLQNICWKISYSVWISKCKLYF